MNYIKLTTNLPQTNHLICRLNQKKNPSEIPLVLSRYNQNQNENQNLNQKEKITKRIRVKDSEKNPCNP